MISNLSPQSQNFLADVDRVQQSVAQASGQISSGLRVNVASDAPDVISQLLQLRSNLQKNTQITTNLGMATTDANVAESTLDSATQLMDNALSLAAQGATGTMTASDRQNLAGEVQAVEEQMLGFSQTQSGGRYVFSGDQDTQPTYQLDLSNANLAPNGNLTGTGAGVDMLITPSNTRVIENPAGGTFAVSMTAQQIFDDRNPDGSMAADNVFHAIDSLRTALLNNDQTGITNATVSLRTASDHLNQCLAFYGTTQNRIQAATTFAANYDIQLKTQISQIEDADVTAASLELSQGTTHIQAAFQMEANIPRTTLFDFLK
ncbi:MAG TPA: flagellin [Bryobacteraceae bacterium]|jgi:flagellar hook-associated protein 3 FlgL|nr:flagellin [Bryobacteraceae bacterium]